MKNQSNRIVQSLKRAYGWLAYRPLHLTWLRVYEQVVRLMTGAPIRRYSEVTPLLHIGGQHYPNGMAEIEARGIKAVVNLRKEFDDTAAGVATDNYLHLLITDNTPPSQEQLRSGVEFITRQIEQGNGVYIHCGVGAGRAPTVAAAYLVSTGMTPEEAWRTLRAVRPFIWPNRRQRASVQQYAEELKVNAPA
jgi:predicted protein tyrosine phosphatase